MNKKTFLLSATTLLVLTLSVLGFSGCSKQASAEPLKLYIGSMPTQTASIYAVGIDQGIFKKHGLDVQLTIFNSAVERDTAATAGKVDGFLTDIMGAINLKEHGFDFPITSTEYENFSILAGPKQASKSISDLKGLKIGIANNTVTEYVIDQAANSLPTNKVNVPKVPERLVALMSDNVQAAVFPEPFSSIIKAKGGHEIASSSQLGLQPVVFVFSKATIKNQPKAVENFYLAYNETVAYMKKTPYDDYKKILLNHKLVKPELIDVVKLPLDHFGDAKMVQQKDLDSVLLWMKDKAMIHNSYDFKTLTDGQFIK